MTSSIDRETFDGKTHRELMNRDTNDSAGVDINEFKAKLSEEDQTRFARLQHRLNLVKRARQKKEFKAQPDETIPPVCHSVAIFRIIIKHKRKAPE